MNNIQLLSTSDDVDALYDAIYKTRKNSKAVIVDKETLAKVLCDHAELYDLAQKTTHWDYTVQEELAPLPKGQKVKKRK